jgi:hypothetical protein
VFSAVETSCPISFRFVCNTTPSYVHVYAQATMYKQQMHSKTFIKCPTSCTPLLHRRLGLSTSKLSCLPSTFPHPPSVVDSRRPLLDPEFRSSVARNPNAWNTSKLESDVSRNEYTAASSTGTAPFAILCLPGCGLLANGLIALVPPCSRSLRHSSSVATHPSRSTKNLCRTCNGALMRSRAWLLNQSSHS